MEIRSLRVSVLIGCFLTLFTSVSFSSPPPPAPGCNPGTSEFLHVPHHPQETDWWCWAASAQMVMHYLGKNVSQCTQANDMFNRPDCPCDQCGIGSNPNPPCLLPAWPDFDKYEFTYTRTRNRALTWKQIKEELSGEPKCGKTPFVFSLHTEGGGGHMMVAIGYKSVRNFNFVTILDPWAPCHGDLHIFSYEAYVKGKGYSHWDDFYRIRKKVD